MSAPPTPARGLDRAARDELIRLARALVAGESFVEDFQLEMFALTERTADRAVKELGQDLDGLYSDLVNHKLTGRYAITGERLQTQ